jgi:hypothetical protein
MTIYTYRTFCSVTASQPSSVLHCYLHYLYYPRSLPVRFRNLHYSDPVCCSVAAKLSLHFLILNCSQLSVTWINQSNILCERALNTRWASVGYGYRILLLLYWRYNPTWLSTSSLGLGFLTVKFSGMSLLTSRLTTNLEDQGLYYFWPLTLWPGRRDSVVGIATGYGLFESRKGREFSLLHVVETGSGVHPASYPMGPGILSQGVKRPECEADHSPPTSAEVKKIWIYTFIPPYAFMA